MATETADLDTWLMTPPESDEREAVSGWCCRCDRCASPDCEREGHRIAYCEEG